MAISCVSTPGPMYGSSHEGFLRTVDGVVSKLELSLSEKENFLPQISKVADESIFQQMSRFSEGTAASLLEGNEKTFVFALFVMIAFYVGGDKKNEPFPEFIKNIFSDYQRSELEAYRELVRDRELVRGGATTPFSLYGPGHKLGYEELYKLAELDSTSSKEAIAYSILDHNRFNKNAKRRFGCMGWQHMQQPK